MGAEDYESEQLIKDTGGELGTFEEAKGSTVENHIEVAFLSSVLPQFP